jgi:hypothetical protein
MGAVKKIVFVGALAAVGAVIAKKLMDSSNENAWESAGGWDSTSSTDWSRKASDAASTAGDKAADASVSAADAADDTAKEAKKKTAAAADKVEDAADSATDAAETPDTPKA